MPRRLLDHKLQMREINFNYSVCTVQLFLFCFALMEHWLSYCVDELNISCFRMAQGMHLNAWCKLNKEPWLIISNNNCSQRMLKMNIWLISSTSKTPLTKKCILLSVTSLWFFYLYCAGWCICWVWNWEAVYTSCAHLRLKFKGVIC